MNTSNQMLSSPVHPRADDALAAVAHDLRLPLSHIKGFVSSLRRTDVEWDMETRREFLAEIEIEADRLADLVESLLEAGRPKDSTARNADLPFTRPATVIEGAIHRVRGPLAERVVRCNVPADLPPVRVNVTQMERVLANLLQNAIKYTPSDTPIDISARITPEHEMELIVADRGPGVPAADRDEIFQPFFRSYTPGSAVPGHGLGLAICQSIVLAHGGRMAVTDRAGGGASFSVFLPLQRTKERGNDSANHSRRRRRSTNAQNAVRQSESQRLRGPRRGGWHRGPEADRGAPVRPAAA
jgi:two-component system, OmpR family, sensor histidine kinase KdpD